MNREILFKAKRKDNGEWVKGYYVYDYSHDAHYIFANIIATPNGVHDRRESFSLEYYEIDPYTLCQYTGLTDKYGKEIWENDIISIHAYSYYEPEDDYFGVVKYCVKDACWALKNNERFDEIICECFGSYTTEIINHGNIFDNPELLEVE